MKKKRIDIYIYKQTLSLLALFALFVVARNNTSTNRFLLEEFRSIGNSFARENSNRIEHKAAAFAACAAVEKSPWQRSRKRKSERGTLVIEKTEEEEKNQKRRQQKAMTTTRRKN